MTGTLIAVCLAHACSNDVLGVIGDEQLAWDPTPDAAVYQIGRETAAGWFVCDSTTEEQYGIAPGGACDPGSRGSLFAVRACDELGACGNWSDEIEILPMACFRADVTKPYTVENVREVPCVFGAPQRLPGIYTWSQSEPLP